MRSSFTAVQRGALQIDFIDVEVPQLLPGQALMRVEGSGMCGSDYEQYEGAFENTGLIERYPLVPGHEPVGVIVEITREARTAWNVDVGDRVAVEPFASCGVCLPCTRGDYPLCTQKHFYGFTPLDVGSGLWGGYAEYMVLQGNTQLHHVSPHLSIQDAVLFNPIGAGFEWVSEIGQTRPGDTVAIAGPGQRGLASVIAARECGAATIIIAGTSKDRERLSLARELGADHLLNVEEGDLPTMIKDLTGGRGVDQFYDMSAFATKPITDGIDSVRRGGTVVLAGIKGMKPVENFVSDRLVLDAITLRGALAVRRNAYQQALRIIESGKYPALSKMHTHTFPLQELERALNILSGTTNESAIHITMTAGREVP